MLDKSVIHEIIPSSTLNDLNKPEIDNDINYLLNWLQPYFPPIDIENIEDLDGDINVGDLNPSIDSPSQRVKAAVRCLNHNVNQFNFTKLYANSISIEFKRFFNNLPRLASFTQYFNLILKILKYYNNYLIFLNLNDLNINYFHKNLNSLFYHTLIQKNTHFTDLLEKFLYNCLFVNLSPKSSILDIIKVCVSINFSQIIFDVVIRLSISKIISFIHSNCYGVWNKPVLGKINHFINHEIYPNFSLFVSNFDDRVNNIYISELLKIAHDELVSLRIIEIYQLVSSYPFSIQALNELYQCFQTDFNHKRYNQDSQEIDSFDLSNVAYLASYSLSSQAHQRKKLVDAFIENCHRNLLHSGANTVDVISMYNKTIRAFLIVDPKGVLLDKVVRPIRKYLKTRDDVIIKLVHGLLDNDPNSNNLIELAHELRNCGDDLANKTIEDAYGLNWVPDPIDALPDFKKGKVSDIIESLVSIFDSKEVFIDEFNKLFGERLMNIHNYDVSEVKTYINLLKSRFGKNEFTTLDVMIKDISDSEGINAMLQSTTAPTPFHSSIISHNYWSTILDNLGENDEFEVPQQILNEFQQFEHKFSEYKRGRLLKLVPSLGSVKLNLTFKNNVTKSFEVNPVKASVISLFDDEENELSVDTISEKLKMSSYVVTQVLQYWVKEGVLSELTKTLYIVNDELECENESMTNDLNHELESLPKTSSMKAVDNAEYDDILWPYMRSILESFNTISLIRLKELLTLTLPKSKLDLTKLENLTFDGYLDWLLEQGKIDMVNGKYKLKV